MGRHGPKGGDGHVVVVVHAEGVGRVATVVVLLKLDLLVRVVVPNLSRLLHLRHDASRGGTVALVVTVTVAIAIASIPVRVPVDIGSDDVAGGVLAVRSVAIAVAVAVPFHLLPLGGGLVSVPRAVEGLEGGGSHHALAAQAVVRAVVLLAHLVHHVFAVEQVKRVGVGPNAIVRSTVDVVVGSWLLVRVVLVVVLVAIHLLPPVLVVGVAPLVGVAVHIRVALRAHAAQRLLIHWATVQVHWAVLAVQVQVEIVL